MKRYAVILWMSLLFGVLLITSGSWVQIAQGGPQCVPTMAVPIEGGRTFVTWVPSEAAPDRGIVLRILYPDRPRYSDETAAVVEVPGGDSPGGVELSPPAAPDPFVSQGLISAQFTFPGGGRPPYQSGGTYDHRGLSSLKALRDVVRYLQGELRDREGCLLSERLPYKISQLGLVGSSNGGNTAVVALGLFGEQMAVDWYVGWENPAGVQFVTVDLGSRDRSNPAYIPGSCRLTPEGTKCDVDYTQLRWDPEAVARGRGPQGGGRQGILYHDFNGNGRYDPRASDYALGAFTGTSAGQEKRVYSPSALEAAIERNLLTPWPEDVATLEEARDYWAIRDMSRYYDKAIEKLPELRVIVIGSVQDHVQGTPDYPHIVLQVQGWHMTDISWVRLNPDAAYVEAVVGQAPPAVDNDANMLVNYANIAELLEPEGVPDSLVRLAAVLELSDRTDRNLWIKNLGGILRLTRP